MNLFALIQVFVLKHKSGDLLLAVAHKTTLSMPCARRVWAQSAEADFARFQTPRGRMVGVPLHFNTSAFGPGRPGSKHLGLALQLSIYAGLLRPLDALGLSTREPFNPFDMQP